jgi:hypothetical protein
MSDPNKTEKLSQDVILPEQDRTILPAPESPFKGKIEIAMKDSTQDWPQPLKAPAGAPNVFMIIGDDVGFGTPSAFGGPVNTPVFDRIAQQGLRYVNFHTTAVCAASRAAFLTGRNGHSVGFGFIPDCPAGFPGYDLHHPAQRSRRARNPAHERLRHRLDWQVRLYPQLGSHDGRTV